MPRRVRFEAHGAIHHVVPQGNGRRAFVIDDHDRRSYLARFHRIARDRHWIVHASSLLDTHHHAVVETPEPDLGEGMRLILGGHAAYFNDRHARRGAVFGERYWSRRVSREGLLVTCLYALLNPVAAGLVRHPGDHEWCSYRTALSEGLSDRLASHLGETPDEARLEFVAMVDRAVERAHLVRAVDMRGTWCVAAESVATRSGYG